jgi:DNA helicase-2/ATP-dependent DNA helicase PcrA
MTRAKEELSLITPMRFYTHGQARGGDRHVIAARSRFLPPAVLPHFDRIAWPQATPEAAPAVSREGPKVDIAARMRGMWR